MSRINLHNYEAFYLDYIEGTLNAENTAELLLFLENHPDLKDEIDDFELIELPAKEATAVDFSELKQSINATNAEDYIIQSIEKQISEEDQVELDALLKKDAATQKLHDRYLKTILPIQEVPFLEKEKLKRKAGIIIPFNTVWRAAAAIVLLIALYPLFNSETKPVVADNQIKVTDSVSTTTPKPKNETNPTEKETSVKKDAPVSPIKQTVDPKPVEYLAASNAKQQSEILPKKVEIKALESKTINGLQVEFDKDPLVANLNTPFIPTKIEKTNIEDLMASSSEPLTIGEWLNKNIRERLMQREDSSTEKLAANELLEEAAKRLNDKTNTTVAYKHNASNNGVSYSVTIGKFSFSKIKSN